MITKPQAIVAKTSDNSVGLVLATHTYPDQTTQYASVRFVKGQSSDWISTDDLRDATAEEKKNFNN